MKKIISALHLKLSDLFLLIGFIPMTVFLINGQLFMQFTNPDDVSLKLEIIIPLFVLLLLSWGTYIYLERNNIKDFDKKYVAIIFIIVALISVIGVLIQPTHFEIEIIKWDGGPAHISLDISTTHRVFFTFDIISILLFIYIGIFVFPKRFTSIKAIQVFGYLVFLFCFMLMIYSYFAESSVYNNFISALMSGDEREISANAAKSFIIHKNAYGMVLLLGIIFCIINHSISRRLIYFPIAIFFYINMIFTFCKTSLLLSPIILLIYTIYYLVTTLSENKKIKIITLSIIFAFLLIAVTVVGASYFSKGAFAKPIYSFINALADRETINSRKYIWDNTYHLLFSQNILISLLFGRGFGLINEMLLPMNIANWNGQLAFPTHNGYLNLFAEGGLICLFAYLLLLGYSFYIAIKCFKKNPYTTLGIVLGLITFVFYSLIETIHYLTYIFMFVLLSFYNIQNKKDISNQ